MMCCARPEKPNDLIVADLERRKRCGRTLGRVESNDRTVADKFFIFRGDATAPFGVALAPGNDDRMLGEAAVDAIGERHGSTTVFVAGDKERRHIALHRRSISCRQRASRPSFTGPLLLSEPIVAEECASRFARHVFFAHERHVLAADYGKEQTE